MHVHITAKEASYLLNVSIPWFLSDVAPSLRYKMHRPDGTLYSRSDVLAWKERHDQLREESLNELAAMDQEMWFFYDGIMIDNQCDS